VSLSTEIRVGNPAREIVRRARDGGFDLVVLGTRGLNGARRLLLGSTTASVLRHARVPVLTIPGALARRPAALEWPPQRLLGAIELGAHTRADAAAYAAVATALGVPLTLLHVVPVPPAPGWYSSTRRRAPGDSPAAVQQALQRLHTRYADVVDEVAVLAGDPPTGIHAAASARRGALILMTLRSRPGLFGSRAGAVAYEVLCRAAAPVLALPT
jgi:nucleotide-binding universal stress UspA family protein